MKKYAIIVAGGSGTRMGADVPKQFLPLAGEPLLMRTLRAFAHFDHTILVLPEAQKGYWSELCEQYGFDLPHTVVNGGSERFFSVKNALDSLSGEGLVAIHDGVRPLVSRAVIDEACGVAANNNSAVPVIPVVDSLRKLNNNVSTAVSRDGIYAVQTPQVFKLQILKTAYGLPYSSAFTDDASVFEAAGNSVSLCKGERFNIKITTPDDLRLAEALINSAMVK